MGTEGEHVENKGARKVRKGEQLLQVSAELHHLNLSLGLGIVSKVLRPFTGKSG